MGQSILYLHLSQDLMSFSSIHAGLSKLSLKERGTVESLDWVSRENKSKCYYGTLLKSLQSVHT